MNKHPQSTGTITGIITTTRKGLGFITDPKTPEAARKRGEVKDIMIDEGRLNTAMNGDTVEVLILPPRYGKDPMGEVTKVISRAKETFVGTIDVEQGMYFLIPDDKKMYTDIVIP